MKHLEKLSEAELLGYARKRMPMYRRILARAKSFLSSIFGRGMMRATASDEAIEVGGDRKIKPGRSGQFNDKKDGIAKFKVPPAAKLKQHLSALHDSDALDELEYILNRLNSSENRAMRAEAKRMAPMLQAMQETFDESLNALGEIADKHIPIEVDRVFESAAQSITKIMRAYTGDAQVETIDSILVGSEEDQLDFVQYFDITEYMDTRTFVVVTCALTKRGEEYMMSRHVNVLDRFQAPFSYDMGAATDDIEKSVEHALAEVGVTTDIGALPLKVDNTRVQRAVKKLDFVTKVDIDETTINVYVKGNKQVFDQGKEIFATLSADTDIRRMMGRKKRLVSKFTDGKYWQFTLNSRG